MALREKETEIINNLGDAMRFKFLVHRNKGGWENKSIPQLFKELKREVEELEEAYIQGHSTEAFISECGDVANYAAMLMDAMFRENTSRKLEEGDSNG